MPKELRDATVRSTTKFTYSRSPDVAVEYRIRQLEEDIARYTLQLETLLELLDERRRKAIAEGQPPGEAQVEVAPSIAQMDQQMEAWRAEQQQAKPRGRARKEATT